MNIKLKEMNPANYKEKQGDIEDFHDFVKVLIELNPDLQKEIEEIILLKNKNKVPTQVNNLLTKIPNIFESYKISNLIQFDFTDTKRAITSLKFINYIYKYSLIEQKIKDDFNTLLIKSIVDSMENVKILPTFEIGVEKIFEILKDIPMTTKKILGKEIVGKLFLNEQIKKDENFKRKDFQIPSDTDISKLSPEEQKELVLKIYKDYINGMFDQKYGIKDKIKIGNPITIKNEILNMDIQIPNEDKVEKMSQKVKEKIDNFINKILEVINKNKILDKDKLEIKAWLLTYFEADFIYDLENNNLNKTKDNEIYIYDILNKINERSIYGEVFNNLSNVNGEINFEYKMQDKTKLDVLYCSPQNKDKKIYSAAATNDGTFTIESKRVYIDYTLRTNYFDKIIKNYFQDNSFTAKDIIEKIENPTTEREEILKKQFELSYQNDKNQKIISEMIDINFNQQIQDLTTNLVLIEEEKTKIDTNTLNGIEQMNEIREKEKKIKEKKIKLEEEKSKYKDYKIIENMENYVNAPNYQNTINKIINEVLKSEEIGISFIGGEISNKTASYERTNMLKNLLILKTYSRNHNRLTNDIPLNQEQMKKVFKNINFYFDKEYYTNNHFYNVDIKSLEETKEIYRKILLNDKSCIEIINNIYSNHNKYLKEQSKRLGKDIKEIPLLKEINNIEEIVMSIKENLGTSNGQFKSLLMNLIITIEKEEDINLENLTILIKKMEMKSELLDGEYFSKEKEEEILKLMSKIGNIPNIILPSL